MQPPAAIDGVRFDRGGGFQWRKSRRRNIPLPKGPVECIGTTDSAAEVSGIVAAIENGVDAKTPAATRKLAQA